jgi:nucleoside-diphosphate-sugar epimerase
VAKSLAEETLAAIAQCQEWDCWILRLPGLFSEQRRSGALFQFMRAASEGRPLRILADRPTPWDVLHVEDAVEAIVRALRSDRRNPGVMNVAYGDPIDLVAMARQIAARSQWDVQVENPSGVQHPVFQMDIRKARDVLGWPPATLEARLARLWNVIAHERHAALKSA